MHRHKEKGSVAIIRRIDTRASNRAQHPGPSGSAGKKNKYNYYKYFLMSIPRDDNQTMYKCYKAFS